LPDPLEFLFSLERLGMKFGLENMTRLCEALDHPERSFQSIIVAGTNGKGSVTAMTAAALHAAAYRSARYTSPHLERLEERFVIGEREVATRDLVEAADTVKQAIETLVQTGALGAPPTFFECATAIAFELFRRASVEVAVLEVGLGGRLDATNIVTPIAAAITSIDFDHQDLLGTTLESIAREKAGVIKPGMPVVLGLMPSDAVRAIEDTCRERGARAISAAERVRVSSAVVDGETIATLATPDRTYTDVQLALRGRHQTQNASVAVCLLEELNGLGLRVNEAAIRAGLTDATWPGRLERVRWHGADVLLDAAHNPAGARALADYLRDIGWTRVTLVFGAMRDKDVGAMLPALLPFCASLICTSAPSPRALPADQLATLASRVPSAPQHVEAISDPEAALTRACAAGARVVAAGSIFLIGPLRGIVGR
jgi:dihydrofolate synthase / folylpolyglutamate synthase